MAKVVNNEKFSVDEILEAAKKGSVSRKMRTFYNHARLDVKFNRFIEDPTKSVPKIFSSKELANEFIEDWQDAIGTAGMLDVDAKRELLNSITEQQIQDEVMEKKDSLTKVRGVRIQLNEEQEEALSIALQKFADALKAAVSNTAEFQKVLGNLEAEETQQVAQPRSQRRYVNA